MFDKFSISGINALPRFGVNNNTAIDISGIRPIAKNISLYIHIPFCKSICHFCMLRRGAKAVNEVPQFYIDYIIKDIELHKINFEGCKINAVYFGGGTPSMLNSKQLEKILYAVYENFTVSPNVEITFEGEPQSLSNTDLLSSLKNNGVERVSFGLQTFNSELRAILGRTDTIKDVENLFSILSSYSFKEINIDYLYNLPDTNVSFLEEEFLLIKNLNPTSIDCHPLKYISCSGFMLQNIVSKRMSIPDSTLRIEMFNFIRQYLLNNRFKEQFVDQYSIYEKSETNQYMRNLYGLDGGEYLGIGPGSRSHYGNIGFTKNQNIDSYISTIQGDNFPIERITNASLIDNYITCFPKRNDKLFLTEINNSSNSKYFITQLQKLNNGGYIAFEENYYTLTSLGLSWYQNLQEILLSPTQRNNHLESVEHRRKKIDKHGSYFENLGAVLC
jgi:oxygen-independent coproporphyrinogen-3 oxidase